jgi:pimeloyl-ACP methyl ester carboxylesterase/class 3 adenylate cyclase
MTRSIFVIPETYYAKSGGDHIAYQVLGEGPLDLVFISAWFSLVDGRWEEPAFARMLERLASFSRLILFDKRGSGASDPLPATSTTWEDWADDVRIVLDAVGSNKAAICGVGDSGPIAVLFSATYPDRVSALIVANTAARLIQAPDYPWGMRPEDVETFLKLKADTWGTGGMINFFSPSMVGDERYKRWWARYQRMSASPSVSASVAKLILDIDVRQVLQTIRVPTLVIQRDKVPMVPVEHGRFLGENIPNAKYVELKGEDYFLFQGDMNAVIDEIEEFLTGMRRGPEIDRLLATVMFTDIVGSTDRAAELGDRRWSELLDTHDSIVRKQLDSFRGRLIKSTGDGLLATFDGPARAVRCSMGVRDSLQSVGIDIRTGLHTGEIEVRGDDVGGIAVHIGARVMHEAGAREVLVSSTVKDLVTGSGITFEDRGTHQLKGVPDEWHLYAAVGA